MKTVILTAIITILLSLYFTTCNIQRKRINSLIIENQGLSEIINRDGKRISEQTALLFQQEEDMEKLTDSIFNLKRSHEREIKKVIAYYKGTTVTKIDTLEVPFVDSAQLAEKDSIIQSYRNLIGNIVDSFIFVPRRVEKNTDGVRFAGTIHKDHFTIDSLSIPDTLQLRFVEKGGFLKKRSTTVQFFHTNPYITTTQANSVLYKPPKKFPWGVVVGVAAGLIIGKL